MVDVRFESLEALRFKGACFVLDFRCESLEAIIFMRVNWPRFLGRDNTMHSWQSHQSGRTPNLSLKLQPPSEFGHSNWHQASRSRNRTEQAVRARHRAIQCTQKECVALCNGKFDVQNMCTREYVRQPSLHAFTSTR